MLAFGSLRFSRRYTSPMNTYPAAQYGKRSLKSLRLGFVPLVDCAPLVIAKELNLFAKYGLSVALSREIGWATIRDKIIYDSLDAAHALAPMPFAATLGLGSVPSECITSLVLNMHGNALTLSSELWSRGVRDARTLRLEIERSRGSRTYTFGVVFPHSSHNFLLRQWLASGGINPDRDVRIVVVPAPSMVDNLRIGNLDGYCVGEPWNAVAVEAGIGWCAWTSAELSPNHPEKVLMVRRAFAEQFPEEHLRLIAALLEACAYCDEPANREALVSILARPEYINAPTECLRRSLIGPFDYGYERIKPVPEFHVFHRHSANEPSADKAAWVLRHLVNLGALKNQSIQPVSLAATIFREDLFQQACELMNELNPNEKNLAAKAVTTSC